jgi:hypothetical protein
MLSLPQAPANFLEERRGVVAVATFALDVGLIWRETPVADVGIDGQLEYLDANGRATGRLIAVQVKSGMSWFTHETPTAWHYYLQNKHQEYWERFPLPVILMLHRPDTRTTYWADARQYLRTGKVSPIPVPKVNILNQASRDDLFLNIGGSGSPFIEHIDDIIRTMIKLRSADAGFPVSYFQLFTLGLINIGRTVFFNIGLAGEIAELNMAMNETEWGLGLGSTEYDFVYKYIEFLAGQNVADVNYSDCLVNWYDRELVPTFMAPLTRRGRQLVNRISELEDSARRSSKLAADGADRIAQESSVRLDLSRWGPARLSRIRQFESLVSEDGFLDLSANVREGSEGQPLGEQPPSWSAAGEAEEDRIFD